MSLEIMLWIVLNTASKKSGRDFETGVRKGAATSEALRRVVME
jgi:hypothetical protein